MLLLLPIFWKPYQTSQFKLLDHELVHGPVWLINWNGKCFKPASNYATWWLNHLTEPPDWFCKNLSVSFIWKIMMWEMGWGRSEDGSIEVIISEEVGNKKTEVRFLGVMWKKNVNLLPWFNQKRWEIRGKESVGGSDRCGHGDKIWEEERERKNRKEGLWR